MGIIEEKNNTNFSGALVSWSFFNVFAKRVDPSPGSALDVQDVKCNICLHKSFCQKVITWRKGIHVD